MTQQALLFVLGFCSFGLLRALLYAIRPPKGTLTISVWQTGEDRRVELALGYEQAFLTTAQATEVRVALERAIAACNSKPPASV